MPSLLGLLSMGRSSCWALSPTQNSWQHPRRCVFQGGGRESLLQQVLSPSAPFLCVSTPCLGSHRFPSWDPPLLLPTEFLDILKAQPKEPSLEPSAVQTFSYLILSVSSSIKWK